MNNTQNLVAGVYQIINSIGSGGGGIIYLAYHTRLNKNVILKADKRSVSSTKIDSLRREVDALKNLSHSNIPQVYDFVVQDGVVYTVIEYIEGESFDKLLKNGREFTQAEIVTWSKQLLSALVYLHSRPPYGILHADIKPANIMLSTNGEVSLIDYNIALALGEEGAVAVGRSFGYASPEHYNYDAQKPTTNFNSEYRSALNDSDATVIEEVAINATVPGNATQYERNTTILATESDAKTQFTDNMNVSSSGSFGSGISSGKGKKMLDVRSDVYSLAATLYHMITGKRPEKNALEVIPLTSKDISPAVADIINKAMNPAPNKRFQTAQEMLNAINNLHKNDKRTKQYKRAKLFSAMFVAFSIAIGGFITFVGLSQLEDLQNSYLLAELSDNALQEGEVEKAVSLATQALSLERDLLSAPNTPNAQLALTNALGVYEISDGFKSDYKFALSNSPQEMLLSPNGDKIAVISDENLFIYDAATKELLVTLNIVTSALSKVEFITNDIIAYAAKDGFEVYDIASQNKLWSAQFATSISVSGDKTKVATLYKDDTNAYIYDMQTGELLNTVDFLGKKQRVLVNDTYADADNDIFELNYDGSILAASFEDSSVILFYPDEEIMWDLGYTENTYSMYDGVFFENYFALVARSNTNSLFASYDVEEQSLLGSANINDNLNISAGDAIYLSLGNKLVEIDAATGEQNPLVTTSKQILDFKISGDYTFVSTEDEYLFFDESATVITSFARTEGIDYIDLKNEVAVIASFDNSDIRVLRYEEYEQNNIFEYDTALKHNETRLNNNQSTVMLFSFEEFWLYDISGSLIAHEAMPNGDNVYDQQYIREENESYLYVFYYDGTVNRYSAENGTLISENKQESPSKDLYEEFYTDNLKIVAELNTPAVIYESQTEKQVAVSDNEDNISYVTQLDEFVLVEYISSSGYRYGELRDNNWELYAKLPHLCDAIGDTVYFDYPNGNVRKTSIYNLEELLN